MAAKRRFVGLDGLKGIALIAIVLYHCDELSLQGGFFGVDVFFTISGFLIFSSLLNRHPEPDHDRASGMLQLVCHQQRSQLFLPDEP